MNMRKKEQSDDVSRYEVILDLLRTHGTLGSNTIRFLSSLERNQLKKVLDSLSRYGKVKRITSKQVLFWGAVGE